MYDYVFVEEQLLGGMRKYSSQSRELLSFLASKALGTKQTAQPQAAGGSEGGATGGDNSAGSGGEGGAGAAELAAAAKCDGAVKKRSVTVPEPFHLTKPRIKPPPVPEHKISTEYHANPVIEKEDRNVKSKNNDA